MQLKAIQADTLLDELEENIKNQYNTNEIELLKRELEIYKQAETKDGIAVKLKEISDENVELRNKIESKESENIKAKRRINEFQNAIDIKDREINSLKLEVNSLREEVDNQKSFDDQFIESHEPIEKLREKNKHIQELLEKLNEMKDMNIDLANQIRTLKIQLNNATNEMELTNNEMEMVRAQMEELKSLNEDLINEKQSNETKIKHLQEMLDNIGEDANSIYSKVEERNNYYKMIIQQKEEEILRLSSLVSTGYSSTKLDGDQQKFFQEIQDKNKEIGLLKAELSKATHNIEEQTKFMQKMLKESESKSDVDLNKKIDELNNKIKTLEDEVGMKDEEIVNLKKRNNLYEDQHYGLSDANKEIANLEKIVANRDLRIEELIKQINELNIKLNEAEDEIDYFKENYNVDDKKLSRKEVLDNKNLRIEKTKLIEMQRQLYKLEEEKILLEEQLLKQNKELFPEDENKVFDNLNQKLKVLQEENIELQIGMKEILNGIKVTDSKSAVIIECPSLERLCQQLESRTISGDLTNIIVLKAELDLIRGHNDQLRMELKQMRNDHLALIDEYTRNILESHSIDEEQIDSIEEKQIDSIQEQVESIKEEQEKQEDNKTEEVSIEEKHIKKSEKEVFDKETQTSFEVIQNVINENERKEEVKIEYKEQINSKKLIVFADKEVQVEESELKPIISTIATNECSNCKKVMKVFESLKDCVDKLKQNVEKSEQKYCEHTDLLLAENKVNCTINFCIISILFLFQNLNAKLNDKLIEKEKIIKEKEEQITELRQFKLKNIIMREELSVSDEKSSSEESVIQNAPSKNSISVLQTMINCLQVSKQCDLNC